MKRLVEEVSGEGLDKLLGETVLLMCANLFYHGKLIGVNTDCVLLENPSIIYETGEWPASVWKDKQAMGVKHWYVVRGSIESFGAVQK